ncbi:hypothetical protein [Hyphomonas johnsonii]|uniref:Glycerophosphoryl diester phosphodiesterase membrane domain-containing protein n=1 Tax=Hyphomonas johnsonii MHS-2 TaxID=1280950 RepID=A0A059F9B7_9PROT|nr:hypothetical protein [Hyphomonas johnsonii]KCZ87151.1 hypothetical protein HJO_17294 [Hyphomonas johnsonii MHS-2]
MADRLPVTGLVAEAWRLAARSFVPGLRWLGALVLASGLYTVALESASGGGSVLALALLAAVFCAGVAWSLSIYRTMLGQQTGSFLSLAHANISIYTAFLFVSVFIVFFLGILPGILLEVSGRTDLGAETDPAIVQAAIRDMLPTPYGAVLLIACALGLWALCFFAIRLLLVGAATVRSGETLVFRTWPWTKGHALRLGLAALGTHVLPFAVAVGLNAALAGVLGDGSVAGFLRGSIGALLLAPFILAGHGLAVSALPRLAPAPGPTEEIASAA